MLVFEVHNDPVLDSGEGDDKRSSTISVMVRIGQDSCVVSEAPRARAQDVSTKGLLIYGDGFPGLGPSETIAVIQLSNKRLANNDNLKAKKNTYSKGEGAASCGRGKSSPTLRICGLSMSLMNSPKVVAAYGVLKSLARSAMSELNEFELNVQKMSKITHHELEVLNQEKS